MTDGLMEKFRKNPNFAEQVVYGTGIPEEFEGMNEERVRQAARTFLSERSSSPPSPEPDNSVLEEIVEEPDQTADTSFDTQPLIQNTQEERLGFFSRFKESLIGAMNGAYDAAIKKATLYAAAIAIAGSVIGGAYYGKQRIEQLNSQVTQLTERVEEMEGGDVVMELPNDFPFYINGGGLFSVEKTFCDRFYSLEPTDTHSIKQFYQDYKPMLQSQCNINSTAQLIKAITTKNVMVPLKTTTNQARMFDNNEYTGYLLPLNGVEFDLGYHPFGHLEKIDMVFTNTPGSDSNPIIEGSDDGKKWSKLSEIWGVGLRVKKSFDTDFKGRYLRIRDTLVNNEGYLGPFLIIRELKLSYSPGSSPFPEF